MRKNVVQDGVKIILSRTGIFAVAFSTNETRCVYSTQDANSMNKLQSDKGVMLSPTTRMNGAASTGIAKRIQTLVVFHTKDAEVNY